MPPPTRRLLLPCARLLATAPTPVATLTLAVALLALGGCYTTRAAAPEPFRALSTKPPADDAQVVDGVRLDPSSSVRLRRPDGSWTAWVEARHLRLSDDGLFVAQRAILWEDVALAELTFAAPALAEALEAAPPPPGARLERTAGGFVLHAGPQPLDAWLQRLPGDPRAQWRLRTRQGLRLPALDGGELRLALESGLGVADGVRWADVQEVEINNLNGALTWVTIVGTLGSAMAGGPALAMAAAPAGSREVTTADLEADGRVLAAADFLPPRAVAPRPLFSPGAVRRSQRRVITFLGAGSHLHVDLERASLYAGVGLRLGDVVELALALQPYWQAPLATGGTLPGGPLAPGTDAKRAQWFTHARAGVHLEVDAQRRFALPLALEAGLAPGGAVQARLRFGARLRAAGNLWVGLHPFSPTWTRVHGWAFPSSLELGYDL